MRAASAALCAGTLVVFGAQAQEGPLTLGAGLHHSEGEYGTATNTKITTFDVTGRYESGPWTYKASVPYLTVSGGSSVIPGLGNVSGRQARTTKESGMGDIVLSATYALLHGKSLTTGVDLTGKVKIPTADEKRGLGTGEFDYALLVDAYQTFDRVTGFGGVGFHILGDAPGLPLNNVWSANLVFSYKLDERASAGALLEGRERAAPGLSRQLDLVGFYVRKLGDAWKAQGYALIGLADGSPDWGFGLTAARPF